jgi:hypothetical protein
MVFVLTLQPSFIHSLNAQQSNKKLFLVLPAYRRCQPAEVKAIVARPMPIDVLIGPITIENRSPKTITAVKLGWKAYSYRDGQRVALSRCDAPAPTAKVFLSGTTALIRLGTLAPKETCNIGPNSVNNPFPATQKVFVDNPFLKVEDIKSLTLDGALETLKDDYTVVVFVSEISYDDGTTWMAENNLGEGE